MTELRASGSLAVLDVKLPIERCAGSRGQGCDSCPAGPLGTCSQHMDMAREHFQVLT